MLRGVACLLVVLMHITGNFSETYHSSFLGNIFKFGGCGVDIFFVLSGFIITYSNKQYITRASSIGKFLTKRIIRIFPIYWIIISFFLALQLLLPAFYNTHFQFYFTNVISTYLLLPNHEMVNGVSWSLTNELFFYILFALALLIPQKKYSLLLMGVFLVSLLIFPAIIANSSTFQSNGFTEFFLFPMNIEFLLGISIVLIVDKFPKNLTKPVLISGVCLFILFAILANNEKAVLYNSYDRVLMFGIPSFLIILSLVKYELSTNVNVHKLFLELGDASYSIYLFHLPIVAAFFKIMAKLSVTNLFLLQALGFGVLILVCFFGTVIYKKIESPVIKWLNKILL